MDPARFEMRDPVVEIFGARAQMAAGLAQNVGRVPECALAGVGLSVSVRYEGEGTQRAIIGLNDEPARPVGRRLQAHLTTKQLPELRLDGVPRQAIGHALALAATVERHHQPGLFPGAPPSRQPQAKRAVPAAGSSAAFAST